MTSTDYLVDIVNRIKDPANHWGQDEFTIWGGRCAEGELLKNFLQNWKLKDMPYRIWEYVSEITFDKDSLPQNETLLEHGRVFGPGGDLTLRRDGADFRWHFVGQPEISPPDGYRDNNFWDTHPDMKFHQWDNEALLWGKYADQDENGNHRWHDDRVARAKLTYPVPDNTKWERVMIKYWTFSRAGQVQFVWFRELIEWEKEEQDGKRNN
jgi:hypothetical protein